MLQRFKQAFPFRTKQPLVLYGVGLLLIIGLVYLIHVFLKHTEQKERFNEAQSHLAFLIKEISSSKETALDNSHQLRQLAQRAFEGALFSSGFSHSGSNELLRNSMDLCVDFQKTLYDFQSKAKINDMCVIDTFLLDCKVAAEALNQGDLTVAHQKIQFLKMLFDVLLESKPGGVAALKILDNLPPTRECEGKNSLYTALYSIELTFWGSTDTLRSFLNTLSIKKLPFVVEGVSIVPSSFQNKSDSEPLLEENFEFLTHTAPSQFVLKLKAMQLDASPSESLYAASPNENEFMASSVPLTEPIPTWDRPDEPACFFELFSPPNIVFNPHSNELIKYPRYTETELEWIETEITSFPFQLIGWYRHPREELPLLFIYATGSKEIFVLKVGDYVPQKDLLIKMFEERPFPRVVVYSESLKRDFILEEGAPCMEETFFLRNPDDPEQLVKFSTVKPSIEIHNHCYSLLEYNSEKNELILSKKDLKNEHMIMLVLTLSKKSFS